MKKPAEKIKYFRYIRKSTDDDVHQLLSVEGQENELDNLAKRESLTIHETLEESKTAKAPGRPLFNSMCDRIERGEANGILCWDIDRLYRNPVDDGRVRWLLQRGLILSIRTPGREYRPQDAGLLMAVEGGRAQDHILKMATALKRTHELKLKRGQWPGGKTFGFAFDHRTKTHIHDAEESKMLRELFEKVISDRLGFEAASAWLAEQGIVSKLSRKPFSKSKMKNILSNRRYVGIMEWMGETFEDKCPPIIPVELFEAVQKMIKVRSKPRKVRNGHDFPFCGIFRCSCGAMMTAQWAKGNGGTYRYYRCSRKAHRPCNEPYLQEASVLTQCLTLLQPMGISVLEANELRAVIETERQGTQSSFKAELVKTDASLQSLEEKLRKLTRCLLDDVVNEDSYRVAKDEIVTEKTRLKHEKQRLQRSHQVSWIEPSLDLVNTLETLGKTETTVTIPEISKIVQKLGTNHLISRKNVTFSVLPDYDLIPSLLASVRVASSNQSSSLNEKNWWSTRWCA